MTIKELFKTLPVRFKAFQRNVKKEYVKLVQQLQAYAIVATSVKLLATNQVSPSLTACGSSAAGTCVTSWSDRSRHTQTRDTQTRDTQTRVIHLCSAWCMCPLNSCGMVEAIVCAFANRMEPSPKQAPNMHASGCHPCLWTPVACLNAGRLPSLSCQARFEGPLHCRALARTGAL